MHKKKFRYFEKCVCVFIVLKIKLTDIDERRNIKQTTEFLNSGANTIFERETTGIAVAIRGRIHFSKLDVKGNR